MELCVAFNWGKAGLPVGMIIICAVAQVTTVSDGSEWYS